jgi:AcrR family transcriptional regulator
MPRINAPTVAEHHAQQRRALLDAARALLAETGEAPKLGQVGGRAGLARSSVYQYFGSADELLTEVVADVFPDWAARVLSRVNDATTPGTRVWAYVEANIALFASSEQAVARALTRIVDPQVLHPSMKAFHRQLQGPLRQALSELGEPEPEKMGEHIDALILQASRELEQAEPDQRGIVRDRVLGRLHRLLAGYLRLPSRGSFTESETSPPNTARSLTTL